MAILFASGGASSTSIDVGTAGTDRLLVVHIIDERTTGPAFTDVTIGGVSCRAFQSVYAEGSFTDNWSVLAYWTETELGSLSGTQTVAGVGESIVVAEMGPTWGLWTGVASGDAADAATVFVTDNTDPITLTGLTCSSGGVIVLGETTGQGGGVSFSPITATEAAYTEPTSTHNGLYYEIRASAFSGDITADFTNPLRSIVNAYAFDEASAGGGLEIADGALTDGDTVPGETITAGGVAVTDGALSNTSTVPGEGISGGAVTVTDGSLTDPDTVPGEGLSVGGASIADGALVDADTVPGETLSAGAVTVADGALTGSSTVPGEGITPGAATVTDGALSDGDTVPGEGLLGQGSLEDGALVGSNTVPGEGLIGGALVMADGALVNTSVLPGEGLSGGVVVLTDGTLVLTNVVPGEGLIDGLAEDAPVFADVTGVLARGGRLTGSLARGGRLDGTLASGGRWVGKPGGY